ncbi:MAG: hypothetical protein ACRD36_00100 [Candidatus Acidiferrum sp.]
MKRRWNLPIYMGFLLAVVAFVSYFLFFARFPVTRDFPWANLLFFGAALGLVGVGLKRAFKQSERYRGKVSGTILAFLSVAIAGFFVFFTFAYSKQLPASKGAPQVGQKAPDFTLPDKNGNAVTLSHLWGTAVAAPETGHADQWVLLIFYRGYW